MNLYTPKQLADSMRVVRKNTILIAEDIPEAQYDYRPAPDCRYDPGRTPEAPSSPLVNCAPMPCPARLHCSPEPTSPETSGADRHDRPRFRAPPGIER